MTIAPEKCVCGGLTHERERISTLLFSFQVAGVSSPGPASNPNLRVWVRYSTGPVKASGTRRDEWGKHFVVNPQVRPQ